MIRFDATVCHPYRCILVIIETLGFGVGRGDAMRGGEDAAVAMAMTMAWMIMLTMAMMEGEGGGAAAVRKGNTAATIDPGCFIPIRARALYSWRSRY